MRRLYVSKILQDVDELKQVFLDSRTPLRVYLKNRYSRNSKYTAYHLSSYY